MLLRVPIMHVRVSIMLLRVPIMQVRVSIMLLRVPIMQVRVSIMRMRACPTQYSAHTWGILPPASPVDRPPPPL
jgi:hypothetical protein